MIRFGVCDNEEKVCKNIKHCFNILAMEECIDLEIDVYNNANIFIDEYTHQFDAIFLGAEMGPDNGIDIARKIRESDSKVIIIFMTNDLKYALEGYEVKAYRYLLKPFTHDSLKKELKGIISEVTNRNRAIIITEKKNVYEKIEVDSIIYIETVHRKTIVHTEKENITVIDSLNSIVEKIRGFAFTKICKGIIINISKVKKYEYDAITMDTGDTLYASRRQKDNFKKAYMVYWKDRIVDM